MSNAATICPYELTPHFLLALSPPDEILSLQIRNAMLHCYNVKVSLLFLCTSEIRIFLYFYFYSCILYLIRKAYSNVPHLRQIRPDNTYHFRPIHLNVNDYVGLKIFNRTNIILRFLADKKSIR